MPASFSTLKIPLYRDFCELSSAGSFFLSRSFSNHFGAWRVLPFASFSLLMATAYVCPYSRFCPGG